MLEARLIFAIEEVEWVSPIVIQIKKGTEDIRVCVEYISLNSSYVIQNGSWSQDGAQKGLKIKVLKISSKWTCV
jgi:hypothetical protein